MSDDVIDLKEERIKRDHVAAEAAHERGEAFRFTEYVYDDDGVGTSVDRVVVVLGYLTGISMSKEDAAKLSEALAHVSKS